jgi:hypothetical protein
MITALLIALVVLGGSAGDVFITKAMKQLGEITLHAAGCAAAGLSESVLS